ncbi:MAG TPA: AAA family ATPase [Candidatus Binataceae bacterium]|nr:AAA family ATPase [Candidatus Binataceae bacterium]
MRIRLIGDSERERAEVRTELEKLAAQVSESGFDEIPADQAECDATMVTFGGQIAAPLAYLQTEARRTPHAPLFALLADRSPVLIRRVLQAGADEVLFLPLNSGELDCALLKLVEGNRKDHTEGAGDGLVCSIVSLSGGVGVTTLSANLALTMHYALGKRAAVMDLDLQSGGLNLYLHIEPQQTIVPLVEIAHKLDSLKLESVLTRHPSGIYLLAAPAQIEDCDLVTDATVARVLGLMRQLFDFVAVDCGHHVDGNTIAAWECSSELLYLIEPSLTSARTVDRFMELFTNCGLPRLRPRVVLNRWDSQCTIAREQLQRAARVPLFATIPRDAHTLARLELRPNDLWQVASGSPLARATERLAQRLATHDETEAEPNRGMLARALSALGVRT